MNIGDQLIAWLNDAHAIEVRVLSTLKAHTEQARDYPRVHTLIEQHLRATQDHAEAVKHCLKHLGAEVSNPANGIAGAYAFLPIAGRFGSLSTGRDALVKNTLEELAAEHLEIACYISLIAAATDLGEPAIAKVCENILEEEEAMAENLLVELPELTSRHLEILYLDQRRQPQRRNHVDSSNFALTRFYAREPSLIGKIPCLPRADSTRRENSAEFPSSKHNFEANISVE